MVSDVVCKRLARAAEGLADILWESQIAAMTEAASAVRGLSPDVRCYLFTHAIRAYFVQIITNTCLPEGRFTAVESHRVCKTIISSGDVLVRYLKENCSGCPGGVSAAGHTQASCKIWGQESLLGNDSTISEVTGFLLLWDYSTSPDGGFPLRPVHLTGTSCYGTTKADSGKVLIILTQPWLYDMEAGRKENIIAKVQSACQATPRIASIRSSETSGRIYRVLECAPIQGSVLRWWRGSKSETLRAIKLGRWLSVNTAGMKYPGEVPLIPLEQMLTETDHPSGDRTSTTPRRLGSADDVEQPFAEIYGIDARTVRGQGWTNLALLVSEMKVESLFSSTVRRMLTFARANGTLR